MKVICIKKIGIDANHLTLGKVYDVTPRYMNDDNIYYCVENDINVKYLYYKSLFITVKEYRRERLKEIINNI